MKFIRVCRYFWKSLIMMDSQSWSLQSLASMNESLNKLSIILLKWTKIATKIELNVGCASFIIVD